MSPESSANAHRPLRALKVPRFGQCVLFERTEHLERVLLRRLADARFDEIDHRDVMRGKEWSKFPKLAGTARRQEHRSVTVRQAYAAERHRARGAL